MAEVRVREIRDSYGTVEGIRSLDADMEDGDLVLLAGPSGCGKSTLLRMIVGLESISSGTTPIGARLAVTLPPADCDIAKVFQNDALSPQKTVAANMAFSLRMRRMDKVGVAGRVARAAETLGLTLYSTAIPARSRSASASAWR